MKSTKKGFTLVELLVVIAILAILATVSVVGYTSFIDKANQSVAMQEMTQIRNALIAEDVVNDYFDLSDGITTTLPDQQMAYAVDGQADGLQPESYYVEEFVATLEMDGVFQVAADGTCQYTPNGKNAIASLNVVSGEITAASGKLVCVHNWVDANCTTPKTCTKCGATEGEALGHTAGDVVAENIVETTCTTDGSYDNVIRCKTCSAILSSESMTVTAHGHVCNVYILTEATCSEKGTEKHVCFICGNSTTVETPSQCENVCPTCKNCFDQSCTNDPCKTKCDCKDNMQIVYTDVTLAVEDNKLLLVYTGLFGSGYTQDTLEKKLANDYAYDSEKAENNANSLQIYYSNYIWYAIDSDNVKHYTVVIVENSNTFKVKCDISAIDNLITNDNQQLFICGHLENENMAVPYTEVTVDFGNNTYRIGASNKNKDDYTNDLSIIYVNTPKSEPTVTVQTGFEVLGVALTQQANKVLYTVYGSSSGYETIDGFKDKLVLALYDRTPNPDENMIANSPITYEFDSETGNWQVIADVTNLGDTTGYEPGYLTPDFNKSELKPTFQNGQTITLGTKTYTLHNWNNYGMPCLEITVERDISTD